MIFEIMFRVIILKMNVQTCGERFLNHQCDIVTGSEHNLASCESSATDPDSLDPVSNDYKNIEQDVTITVLFFEIFSLKIHKYFYFIS